MLSYAATERAADIQEISRDTGIPMGKSSGKTPAILDYCCGMGLIAVRLAQPPLKAPSLTALGRVVFLEDRFLRTPLTQWLAHFHLCRPDGGAEGWFLTFAQGRKVLGESFDVQQLQEFLSDASGGRHRKSLVGPVIRTYLDPAAFGEIRLFSEVAPSCVRRHSAPVVKEFSRGYAAWLVSLLESSFPDQREVTTRDLEERTYWPDITGWSSNQCEGVLALLQDLGAIDVNRQLRPWVITRLVPSAELWPQIYADLV